jgi:hypothetical protein
MVYWDNSAHIPQSIEWSFPSIPSYSSKYVEEVSYHGSFMPHEFQAHQSVYMLPQGQSYSG